MLRPAPLRGVGGLGPLGAWCRFVPPPVGPTPPPSPHVPCFGWWGATLGCGAPGHSRGLCSGGCRWGAVLMHPQEGVAGLNEKGVLERGGFGPGRERVAAEGAVPW